MSMLSLPSKIPDITDRPSFIDSLKEVLQFCADIGAEYWYSTLLIRVKPRPARSHSDSHAHAWLRTTTST